MAENQQTAAQRLAAVQESLQRLLTDQAAAQAAQAAAKADFEALDAQLTELYRRTDIDGADVAADLAAVETQRADAAQRAQDAGLAANDLARRAASVRSYLPALERAVIEEELAAAVAIGTELAGHYRTALQDMLSAAVDFQAVSLRCAGLSDNISRGGWQPAHSLPAHLIEGQELDHVLYVARSGDSEAVQSAIGQLFDRWRI